MNVLVTLKFPVRDSELDNFLTVLKEALIDTRAYDGCQSVSTYVERGTGFVFWWSIGTALNTNKII